MTYKKDSGDLIHPEAQYDKMTEIEKLTQKIIDLEGVVASTNANLKDAVQQRDELKALLGDRDEIIEQLKEQVAVNEGKIIISEEEKAGLNVKVVKLEDELVVTEDKLFSVTGQLKKIKNDYEKLLADIPEVKELEAIRSSMEAIERQRQLDNQRNKALRFRSGLIFQKGKTLYFIYF